MFTDEMPPKQVVGMAYVPPQMFRKLYPVDKGFFRGTIFQELDKPFLAEASRR